MLPTAKAQSACAIWQLLLAMVRKPASGQFEKRASRLASNTSFNVSQAKEHLPHTQLGKERLVLLKARPLLTQPGSNPEQVLETQLIAAQF